MLLDTLHITITSGRGGDGVVKFLPGGKPCGGVGGKGGDVYFQGTQNLYDLKSLANERKYVAENGKPGGANNSSGLSGKDLIIKVPIITKILDPANNEICRITKHGQTELILKGGWGGLGNQYFKAGQAATLNTHTPGKIGETREITIELNLFADVLFVGKPNAGKSSMLNFLTNASVQVAAYPFTTLEPHLGVAGRLILMDFPGLIKDTHKGKGLGTKHIKHAKQAKVIAHFISLENDNLLDTYKEIHQELKQIDLELSKKPELIFLTKTDLFAEEDIETKRKQLKSLSATIIPTSVNNYTDAKKITQALEDFVEKNNADSQIN